ncbi:MAG: hypothetical protein AVDCRST_MAG18-4173, partial [uncultured Thermomicrobiales bacterium]
GGGLLRATTGHEGSRSARCAGRPGGRCGRRPGRERRLSRRRPTRRGAGGARVGSGATGNPAACLRGAARSPVAAPRRRDDEQDAPRGAQPARFRQQGVRGAALRLLGRRAL